MTSQTEQEILNRLKEVESKLAMIDRNMAFESETVTVTGKVQFFDKVLDKDETVIIN